MTLMPKPPPAPSPFQTQRVGFVRLYAEDLDDLLRILAAPIENTTTTSGEPAPAWIEYDDMRADRAGAFIRYTRARGGRCD